MFATTAFNLSLMDLRRVWRSVVSSLISSMTLLKILFKSWRLSLFFKSIFLSTLSLIIAPRFSVGLRSGEWPGHWEFPKKSTPFSAMWNMVFLLASILDSKTWCSYMLCFWCYCRTSSFSIISRANKCYSYSYRTSVCLKTWSNTLSSS